jgi:hypothetical protein
MTTPTLPPITAADAEPARLLQLELTTRITTQPLHYRSGDEDTAAGSVYQLFGKTRELLAKHAQARAFEVAAVFLLNGMLRPYTARWHRWMTDGHLADERSRRQFRYELKLLQPRLLDFVSLLGLLVQGPEAAEEAATAFATLVKSTPPPAAHANLGAAVEAGIGNEIALKQGPLGDGLGNFATVAEINAAEADFIRRRRVALGRPVAGGGLPNATGLCLSGGGIRSATFCLGIVQVLARQGMLQQFDYLSTVSGGGYLGTFMSAILGTPKETSTKTDRPERAAPPAFDPAVIKEALADAFHDKDRHESAAVRHLRNNSRYLLNGGMWGRVRIFGLLVTGILTNLLLLLPVPLAAVFGVLLLNEGRYWGKSWPESYQEAAGWPAVYVLEALAIAVGVLWVLLPVVRNYARGAAPESGRFRFRALWETVALALGLGALGAGALVLVPGLFHRFDSLRDRTDLLGPLLKKLAKPDAVATGVTGVIPVLFGLLAARLKVGKGKRLMTTLFVLSGPLLCLTVFLFVGSRLLLSPEWDRPVGFLSLALALWGWLFVDINEYSPHSYYRARLCECYLAVRGEENIGWPRKVLRRILHGRKKHPTQPVQAPAGSGKGTVGARLRLPISQMNATGAAPYHLLNTTANLPASKEPNLRGRDCDFYTFSREFCGGPVCGFVKTETVEQLDPHIDLGTAMAISAAAASSNMGLLTMRQLRFLITMLNVRLGYWLRSPAAGRRRIGGAPGPGYLFRELTGWMHENTDYLNLSDGGHIENLAMYEMLRRRCKFIVVVDAAMEPGMECAELMLAQRYAQIDLGVRLDLDTADLALSPDRRSRAYAVFGKIRYGTRDGERGDDVGWLVYLKLACTGGEPGYVVDYRRQNPDFPHQTTGDQIYDEAQFEAYRRLGECAAESLFRGELAGLAANPQTEHAADHPPFKELQEWFQALADNLLPDNDPAFAPARREL